MIYNNNLDMDLYNYFKQCQDKTIRGVVVITDKQSIFYMQPDNDYGTHDMLYSKIENEIHPNNKKDGLHAFRDDNIHIASVGHELVIYLPESRRLSLSQYNFLEDIFNQVDIYNKDTNSNLLLYSLYPSSFNGRMKTRNIDEIKDKIFRLVTKEINIEEEKIIGRKLDSNHIINNMIYHIDLESSILLIDIKVSLKRCKMYYEDSYYKDYFIKLFPDYIEVSNIIKKFSDEELFNIEISDINFTNIKDILLSKLNNNTKQL